MRDTEGFVPIDTAARILRTTETRVLLMVKREELAGKLQDGAWYVDAASLRACGRPGVDVVTRPAGCGGCSGRCGEAVSLS